MDTFTISALADELNDAPSPAAAFKMSSMSTRWASDWKSTPIDSDTISTLSADPLHPRLHLVDAKLPPRST